MFSAVRVAKYIYQRENRDFGDVAGTRSRHSRAHQRRACCAAGVAGPGNASAPLGRLRCSVQLCRDRLHPTWHAVAAAQYFSAAAAECGETYQFRKARRRNQEVHITAFDLQESEREIALALRWTGMPARAVVRLHHKAVPPTTIARKEPVFIMLNRRRGADAQR